MSVSIGWENNDRCRWIASCWEALSGNASLIATSGSGSGLGQIVASSFEG